MFEKIEKLKMAVSGMSCMHCVARVEKSLKALNGVKRVVTDLDNGIVEVEFVSSKIDADAMAKAVTAAGYPTKPIK